MYFGRSNKYLIKYWAVFNRNIKFYWVRQGVVN